MINKLDSSYRTDAEKLQDMYELLNRSSRTLNDFEFSKPLLKPFYELIGTISKHFLKTVLFEGETSSRGKIETEITKILALCDERLPDSFSSINDIYMKWQMTNIGNTKKSIDDSVSKNGSKYIETLDRVKKIMDKYTEDELFEMNKDVKRRNAIPIIIIITRTVAIIKQNALFSRHAPNLIKKFREEIIDCDIQQKLECTARNATFQKKLIVFVDEIIRNEIGETQEPRLFPRKMIDEKLEEQQHICPLCNEKINALQKYEGDHIISWINGGNTVKENLQVVHQKCHKRK
jgi:hypothetical protein